MCVLSVARLTSVCFNLWRFPYCQWLDLRDSFFKTHYWQALAAVIVYGYLVKPRIASKTRLSFYPQTM